MIEGRVIVCLASSWDYDPTSKHQIMRILARNNTIIWVNYRGTRKPGVTMADLKGCVSTLRRITSGAKPISPSMVQMTPLVIPGASNKLMQFLHKRMLITQIRRAIRSLPGTQGKPLQVWTFAPDVPYLVGELNEECFVYYCVDEYTEFEGFDRLAIAAAERQLIDRADLVITTSETLWNTKRKQRPDAVLVRHGVAFDHFATAWRKELPRPEDLRAITAPIFGFFGWIHHWIDLELIARVARLRPEYAFVFLGDCGVDASVLDGIPNVFLLGRRRFEDLPAYCRAFRAGLMPFVRSTMTRNINPIKMTEYLAAGLPVVSTALPEAKRHEGPITIAETPEEFAQACDAIITNDFTMDHRTISDTVKDHSWEATVEHVSDAVMSRVESAAEVGNIVEKTTDRIGEKDGRLECSALSGDGEQTPGLFDRGQTRPGGVPVIGEESATGPPRRTSENNHAAGEPVNCGHRIDSL